MNSCHVLRLSWEEAPRYWKISLFGQTAPEGFPSWVSVFCPALFCFTMASTTSNTFSTWKDLFLNHTSATPIEDHTNAILQAISKSNDMAGAITLTR
eukprot:5269825-Ditylum_brightwellii.AAC.1